MRVNLAVLILALLWTSTRTLGASSGEPAVTESLGSHLLDDISPIVPQQPAGRLPAQSKSHPKAVDARSPSTAQFGDQGEDIGGASGPLVLARARQAMRQAADWLGESSRTMGQGALDEAAGAQQQVVAQLDELIAELSRQCEGGQCPPSDQSPSPSQRSQPKPTKPESAHSRGKTAARDSSDPLNRPSAQPVSKQRDISELVKGIWGHLPERSREQMLQSYSGEFLPKYELEIEQYYRQLSEEQSKDATK